MTVLGEPGDQFQTIFSSGSLSSPLSLMEKQFYFKILCLYILLWF